MISTLAAPCVWTSQLGISFRVSGGFLKIRAYKVTVLEYPKLPVPLFQCFPQEGAKQLFMV